MNRARRHARIGLYVNALLIGICGTLAVIEFARDDPPWLMVWLNVASVIMNLITMRMNWTTLARC